MVNGNCAFVGCTNSRYRLRIWGKATCEVHTDQIKKDCPCLPPFALHAFPSIRLNMERRKEWIKLVNRITKRNTPWAPGTSDRVCSRHFVDGRPTLANPNPTLNLGYKLIPKRPRKAPKRRTTTVEIEPVSDNASKEDFSFVDHDYRLSFGNPCMACMDKKEVINSLSRRVTELSAVNEKLQQRLGELAVEVKLLKHQQNKPFSVSLSINNGAKMGNPAV